MNSRLSLTLGGLLLTAMTVVGCGGSSSVSPTAPTLTLTPTPAPAPTPTPGSGVDLVITITGMNEDQSYSPNPASIEVGKKVVFVNADSIVHTATADNGSFDTGNIAPGATSAPITMAAVGSFAYHCKIHPVMVGTLIVADSQGGGGY